MKPVLAALLLQLQAAPPPDSTAAIREEARRAEADFERLARRLAPVDYGAYAGGECDEIVGRFCLRYESGRPDEPEAEPDRVMLARRLAIEALRKAFSFQADEFATSGPLVRYLVEDGRPREALSAARTFAALADDPIWSAFLLGFAHHAAEEDTTAERLFEEALALLPAEERAEILDVDWLLGAGDRNLYGDLDDEARQRFERMLWSFSDPLYLTPGNERRAEHIARHIWSRMLERAPRVAGMVRWGSDLDQLTVRYGVPYARSRTSGTVMREGSLIEHFDPDQLAYVPEELLSRGLPPPPPPGETWSLENPRTRSGHAPETIRRLQSLAHQLTVFPAGDSALVQVDAVLVLDSMAAGHDAAEIGLWVLDSGFDTIGVARERTRARRDTVAFRLRAQAPRGPFVYSAEVLETETELGGRARYAVDGLPASTGVAVSDPLLAHAFGTLPPPLGRDDPVLRPLTDLTFARGDTIGLYAEVHGLRAVGAEAHFRVELTIRRGDRASLPARVVSWLGQRLGLSEPDVPPRLAWTASAPSRGPGVIAVDLQLEGVDAGLQVIEVRVTDVTSGERAVSRRLVRILE
jgi:tetratricopeptide (TPR) repeat protein